MLKGESKALDDNAILTAAGVRDGDELVVKDLGSQVSWKTVFLVEYVRFLSLSLDVTFIIIAKQKKNV